MVQYITALESFDRECEAMHANIIMGEFMATESVGSSVKAGVQAAWEKLKKLILGIWEKIKGFAKKIKNGVQALINMIKKSPDNAETPGKHLREMVDWLKANDNMAEAAFRLLDITLKDIDDLRAIGKKLSKADQAELDALEKEFEELVSKYEDAVKAEQAAEAEAEKASQACDKIMDEGQYDEANKTREAAQHKSEKAWKNKVKAEIDVNTRSASAYFQAKSMLRRNSLDEKKNNQPKKEGAEDSYLGDSYLEPATEAEGGRKLNFSALKQKLANLLHRSEKATEASEQFIDEIKNGFESVKNSASDEREANKKQSLLNKILSLGTKCFNAIKSIPGKIKEIFSRLWSFLRRGKSQVKPYNGPSPVAANDSYLFDPDLNLEIG